MRDHTRLYYEPDCPPGNSTLKRIFEMQAEETISDEQVERVLEPVLGMIKEGKFDRPRRFFQLVQPLALVASIVFLVTLGQGKTARSTFISIPDAEPPLAGVPLTQSGRIAFTVQGISGATLTLVNTDGTEAYEAADMEEDGSCVFSNIRDGTYRLTVRLASGTERMEAGILTVEDGKAELARGGSREGIWKGVDVWVCLTQ